MGRSRDLTSRFFFSKLLSLWVYHRFSKRRSFRLREALQRFQRFDCHRIKCFTYGGVGLIPAVRRPFNIGISHSHIYTRMRAQPIARAKAARINAELKQLQRLSAAAVELAKSDVQAIQEGEANPTDQPLRLSTEVHKNRRLENPEKQPSDEPTTEQLDTLLAVFLATIDRNLAREKLNALVTPAYSKEAWPAPRIAAFSMITLYFLQQCVVCPMRQSHIKCKTARR